MMAAATAISRAGSRESGPVPPVSRLRRSLAIRRTDHQTGALDQLLDLSLQRAVRRLRPQIVARDEDDIVAARQPWMLPAHRLTQQAFGAIALHRLAEF